MPSDEIEPDVLKERKSMKKSERKKILCWRKIVQRRGRERERNPEKKTKFKRQTSNGIFWLSAYSSLVQMAMFVVLLTVFTQLPQSICVPVLFLFPFACFYPSFVVAFCSIQFSSNFLFLSAILLFPSLFLSLYKREEEGEENRKKNPEKKKFSIFLLLLKLLNFFFFFFFLTISVFTFCLKHQQEYSKLSIYRIISVKQWKNNSLCCFLPLSLSLLPWTVYLCLLFNTVSQ